MKVLFIGADPRIADLAVQSPVPDGTGQSCRMARYSTVPGMGWCEVTPLAATTGAEGLKLVEQETLDVVLLHPDFSDLSLSEAITRLRRFSKVPLLVLGEPRDELEVVTALELGADDYVCLPCSFSELMARIYALLRRAAMVMPQKSGEPFLSGPLLINPATYEVFLNRQRLELTATEFQLLHLLARNQGNVVSRRVLEQTIWGESIDGSDLLKKYIQRLRQKLGDSTQKRRWIASVYGVGYRFIGPASEGAASASVKGDRWSSWS